MQLRCFNNKFFRLVKFCVIFTIAVCFVGTTKSYSLVDADKVVEILSWAAGSDFTEQEDSLDVPIIVPISRLLVSFDFTPSSSPPTSPSAIWSPGLSGSPVISESPGPTADKFVISRADNPGEKRFLLSISRGYEEFFRTFKAGPVTSSKYRLLKTPKLFQFFKYAILVRLFEYAIERVRVENVDEYRNKWWYDMIFSCTDEEIYYYNMLYPDFDQRNFFSSLKLPVC